MARPVADRRVVAIRAAGAVLLLHIAAYAPFLQPYYLSLGISLGGVE